MAGYSKDNVLLRGASVTLGASETDTVVSDVFNLEAGDSLHLSAAVTASGVTVTNAVTAKIQSSMDGVTWVDSETVAIAGNAQYIASHAIEANQPALLIKGRIVVSTGVGDAATIDEVFVTRRY